MPDRFNRRPIRRPVVRPLYVVPDENPLLKNAHNLLIKGEYSSAADLFEDAAKEIHARRGFFPPQLLVQAGRARILASQISDGVQLIKKAIQIFAVQRRYPRISNNIRSTLELLNQLGNTTALEDFSRWVDEYYPGLKSKRFLEEQPGGQTKLLPSVCAACGGRVHPDEVDWVNDFQAECAYCGAIIETIH